jgi:hypothetical protein
MEFVFESYENTQRAQGIPPFDTAQVFVASSLCGQRDDARNDSPNATLGIRWPVSAVDRSIGLPCSGPGRFRHQALRRCVRIPQENCPVLDPRAWRDVDTSTLRALIVDDAPHANSSQAPNHHMAASAQYGSTLDEHSITDDELGARFHEEMDGRRARDEHDPSPDDELALARNARPPEDTNVGAYLRRPAERDVTTDLVEPPGSGLRDAASKNQLSP